MSQVVSSSQHRKYGLARVCRTWCVARSTVYDQRSRAKNTEHRHRPGPRGACTDDELLKHIREDLEQSPWVGEGHRKVWARLRFKGICSARRRVLRVMRENDLLAPTRLGRAHGPRAHDGTITPDRPDEIWGIDATSTLTGEGNATIFILVDHCTAECLGIHAARRGTRFEALDPVRQAIRTTCAMYGEGVADGLKLRHDHGSQFISHAFQDEIRFVGIESSPAYVREPEGNGCAERFIRTLKEQILWVHSFDTIDELLRALHDFRERYNATWLIERHGHRSPAEQRRILNESQEYAA